MATIQAGNRDLRLFWWVKWRLENHCTRKGPRGALDPVAASIGWARRGSSAAPPIRRVVVDQIRRGVLEGDAADMRRDRSTVDDVAVAGLEEALRVLLLFTVRTDAFGDKATQLVFDPPGSLFATLDRMACGFARL